MPCRVQGSDRGCHISKRAELGGHVVCSGVSCGADRHAAASAASWYWGVGIKSSNSPKEFGIRAATL